MRAIIKKREKSNKKIKESIHVSNEEILEVINNNYSIKPSSLIFLGHHLYKNDNYILIDESKKKYVFKVFNLNNKYQVENEARVLDKLETVNFPTPRIIKNNNNSHYVKIKKRTAALFSYIEGEDGRNVKLSRETAYQLGKLHAEMHDHLKNVEINPKGATRAYDLKKTKALFERERKNLTDEQQTFFLEAFSKIKIPDSLESGVVHSSVKPLNTIFKSGSLVGFIDFDGCYRGLLLLDVSNTIAEFFVDVDKIDCSLILSYLDGYKSVRKIDYTLIKGAVEFSICKQALKWLVASLKSKYVEDDDFKLYVTCFRNLENETKF